MKSETYFQLHDTRYLSSCEIQTNKFSRGSFKRENVKQVRFDAPSACGLATFAGSPHVSNRMCLPVTRETHNYSDGDYKTRILIAACSMANGR